VENQGFKVEDRRHGATQDKAAAESEPAPEPKPDSNPPAAPGREEDYAASLSTLIISLAAGAQTGLGIAPHPMSGKTEINLAAAKQSIDLLGVLSDKTKGNLTAEEEQLLQVLLHDLRMRYLEAKDKK